MIILSTTFLNSIKDSEYVKEKVPFPTGPGCGACKRKKYLQKIKAYILKQDENSRLELKKALKLPENEEFGIILVDPITKQVTQKAV